MTHYISPLIRTLAVLPLTLILSHRGPLAAQTNQATPKPIVVQLSDSAADYQPILAGPPQTTSMESGFVTLEPGKSGARHSTKGYEEAIIVLSGSGELVVAGGATLKLSTHSVAYCPTETVHHIRNEGKVPLRYVYVAAKAVR